MNKLRVLTATSFAEGEAQEAGCQVYLETYNDYLDYKEGLLIAPSFTAREMGDTLLARKRNVNRALNEGMSMAEAMRMYLPRNLYTYPEVCVDADRLSMFEARYLQDMKRVMMETSPMSNPRSPVVTPVPMRLDDPRFEGGKRSRAKTNVRKGRSRRRSLRRSRRTSRHRRR